MSGFASIAKNGGAGGSSTANASSTTQFGEALVATYVIPFGGSVNLDLKGDNFFLSVGESLTVTAESTTQNATVAAALTWFEDQ